MSTQCRRHCVIVLTTLQLDVALCTDSKRIHLQRHCIDCLNTQRIGVYYVIVLLLSDTSLLSACLGCEEGIWKGT